jgi:hypothetical protein
MSLRFFHIFFIVVAALMSAGVAFIEYWNYTDVHGAVHLLGTAAGIVASLSLLAYAVIFFRKTRNLIL